MMQDGSPSQQKSLFPFQSRGGTCAQFFSRVWLFATLWTVAHQTPLSMGFSREEGWSGLPCSPPGDLPHPGMEPMSPAPPPALQADSLPLSHQGGPSNKKFLLKYNSPTRDYISQNPLQLDGSYD